jgi:hypothetical protein
VFEISGTSDKLLVTVYDQRDGKRGRKIYERNFDPNDTYEITIYALDGDDQVISKHETKSHIRLNIWGGKGADIYSMQGDMRNTIYDAESDGNKLENTSRSKLKKITH